MKLNTKIEDLKPTASNLYNLWIGGAYSQKDLSVQFNLPLIEVKRLIKAGCKR